MQLYIHAYLFVCTANKIKRGHHDLDAGDNDSDGTRSRCYCRREHLQNGSLWADGRARMLVGMDENARMVGDLITVTISERTSTSVMAGTQTTRFTQI